MAHWDLTFIGNAKELPLRNWIVVIRYYCYLDIFYPVYDQKRIAGLIEKAIGHA